MSQIITDHHNITLSDAMLAGERRLITTHNGFKINVPVPTKNLGQMVTVRTRRGVSLTRAVQSLVNRGISARLPLGRFALRIYGHSIDKASVSALGRLRKYHKRHGSDGWAHLNDFAGPRHGNWARLRWWGLIEPRPMVEGETDKDVRGWWRLTGRGFAWLRGDVTVPRTALIFDGAWIGWKDQADLIGPQEVHEEFDLDRATFRKVRGAA